MFEENLGWYFGRTVIKTNTKELSSPFQWLSKDVSLSNINIHFLGTVFWLLQAVSLFQRHQKVLILDGGVGEST